MAEFYVRHSLNYNKTVKFNVSLRHLHIKGARGDQLWILEVGTTSLDVNGDELTPVFIRDVSVDTLEDAIEKAAVVLCSGIDWSPFVNDDTPPHVSEYSPDLVDDVPIGSNVSISIEDVLPSAGIDVSNIYVTLNNSDVTFDITSEVTVQGDPYKYVVKWVPQMRVYSKYDDV